VFGEQQRRYEAWVRTFATEEQLQTHTYDEAGYPGWSVVEQAFATCVADGALTSLDDAEVRAALFLISRSWDLGTIVRWFSNPPALGMFGADDILFLARAALTAPDPALDDARYQLAAVLPLIHRAEVTELLLRLYECPHEYTKRLALYSLASLGYPAIRDLIARSWELDDEYAKIGCLHALTTWVNDPPLLRSYLARAGTIPGEQLAAWRAKLG